MTVEEYSSDDIDNLVNKIIIQSTKQNRIIIAISGVPGSGKTTVTSKIYDKLSKSVSVKILQQDGFHYYLKELHQMPNVEEALERRGAPFTFNVDKLLSVVKAVKQGDRVSLPTFDHKLKDPVEDQVTIGDEKVIILEGNYFNLNLPKWKDINSYIDENWFVSTTVSVAKKRLIQRHLDAGISRNVEEATKRVETNDLVNGQFIIQNQIKQPNVIIHN
ncbi:hypothetical protein CLIB1444_07S00188 [[Candida] jaroonii]|uniref:Uncharacterized protein n=1 Tax=[Candida] jaroonii TaxID=467808 RepID=A0ACA9Y9W0_9ASCO|nr:hypothetical protein CLIB1444_07S00188 [[Candida] jaroonii]